MRQVALEDYELCEKAQYNLERGVYAEGILNPAKETGVACRSTHSSGQGDGTTCMSADQSEPLDYQQRVLEMVLSQHHVERRIAASS